MPGSLAAIRIAAKPGRLVSENGLLREENNENLRLAHRAQTMPDATTLAAVDFSGWSDVKIPDSCPHLQRWYSEVNQRPSAKA